MKNGFIRRELQETEGDVSTLDSACRVRNDLSNENTSRNKKASWQHWRPWLSQIGLVRLHLVFTPKHLIIQKVQISWKEFRDTIE